MDEMLVQNNNAMPFQDLKPFTDEETNPLRGNIKVDIDSDRQPSAAYMKTKRAIDFLMALFGLILSSPLWLLIIIAIKLDSKGSPFYSQERIGKDDRHFQQLKFRSMVQDAEQATGAVLAREKDPRITRVGWLLRKTALDEMPQLINILTGDMSFVGPRPERPEIVENEIIKDVPNFNERHKIRPGLTGLAQVYGKYNTSPRDKLRYDLLYIKNCNLWLDVKLFVLSFYISFRGKWQHRGKKL
ncbi:MAG: sugar transferase [Vulcanimicrobiota bacterium]